MFKVITEIWSTRGDETVLFATNLVGDATVVPAEGDMVVLRTATRGGPGATVLTVNGVQTLSSLDGFLASVWEPHVVEQPALGHRLRKELLELGWDWVMPEPPLPALADEDDFDED